MWGSCRWGLPCHTACRAEGLVFQQRCQKALREVGVPSENGASMEQDGQVKLPVSSSAQQGERCSQGPDQPPDELTPLISLQTYEVNHTGLDPKEDNVVWFSSLQRIKFAAPEPSTEAAESDRPLRAGIPTASNAHKRCPRQAWKGHSLPLLFKLPIQCEEDVKQTSPWSQIMNFLSNRWSV